MRVVTSGGMSESPPQELVRVRASINLPGLPLGVVATVDRTVPYIADAIKHGYLVPTDPSPSLIET